MYLIVQEFDYVSSGATLADFRRDYDDDERMTTMTAAFAAQGETVPSTSAKVGLRGVVYESKDYYGDGGGGVVSGFRRSGCKA